MLAPISGSLVKGLAGVTGEFTHLLDKNGLAVLLSFGLPSALGVHRSFCRFYVPAKVAGEGRSGAQIAVHRREQAGNQHEQEGQHHPSREYLLHKLKAHHARIGNPITGNAAMKAAGSLCAVLISGIVSLALSPRGEVGT